MSDLSKAIDEVVVANGSNIYNALSNIPANATASALATTWLDQVATAFPFILYANTSFLNPIVVESVILLSLATFSILIGSHGTLSKPRNAQIPNSDLESPYYDPTDNDECKYFITSFDKLKLRLESYDSIKLHHVAGLPFAAAGILYGLHYILHKLNAEQVNYWLNVNSLITGTFAIYRNSDVLLTRITRRLGKLLNKDSTLFFERYQISFAKENRLPLGAIERIDSDKLIKEAKKDETWLSKLRLYLDDQGFSVIDAPFIDPSKYFGYVYDLKPLILLPITLGSVYLFYQHNPVLNSNYNQSETNWIILDFISINLAAFMVGAIQIPKFQLAYVLLGGLFFYDAYFVFQTGVMMDVATKINAPIKLLVPKQPVGFNVPQSLLGLGDVGVPGLLVSLCLRFDLFSHHEKNSQSYHRLAPFSKVYFRTAILSYLVGLGGAIGAVHLTGNGQPALFYIVPSMLLAITAVAGLRGEISKLFHYDGGVKEFKEGEYEIKLHEETSDSDYDDSGEDSLDEWIDRVEEKRIDEEDATDIDEIVKSARPAQTPFVYVFESTDSEESDDDTYLIAEDSDVESSDSEDLDHNDNLFADVDGPETIDLEGLKKDLQKEAQEWYSEDEN